MRRRPALAVALGVVAAAIVAGCYSPTKPACGFICGPAEACPDDYSCNTADGRCHLDGTSPAMACPRFTDAGVPDDRPFPFFDGGDTVPPTVLGFSPPSGATNLQVNASVNVQFSELVTNLTKATVFVRQAGSTVPGTLTYDPMTYVATWTPNGQLSAFLTYTASVLPTITDLVGNPLALGEVWTFTTGADQVAPSLVFNEPINGRVGVSVDRRVTVRFDEPVAGVSATTFTLDASGAPITGTITQFTADGATFTPDEQLPANTLLTTTLTSGIRDLAGNAFTGVVLSFATGADLVPPSVVSTAPFSEDTNVNVNATITIVFDEPVTNVNGTTFTVSGSGAPIAGMITNGGRSATFTPTLALPASTEITVTLTGAITDAAANALQAVTFTFTTGT